MSSPLGRRVVVVGNTSSGKSSLGARLAALLDAPFVEIDGLHWKPGWVAASDEEFLPKLRAVAADECWIAAGSYHRQTSMTLWPRAQTVIWLDLPLPTVLWRILVRSWRRSRDRELLWGTNTERFWKHLKLWDKEESLFAWAVSAHGEKRRLYVGAMSDPRWAHIRFVRLRSTGEVEQFMRDLKGAMKGLDA